MPHSHGRVPQGADGRRKACAPANPDSILRGLPDATAFVRPPPAGGNGMSGGRDCRADARRLTDHPDPGLCPVIQGAVGIPVGGVAKITQSRDLTRASFPRRGTMRSRTDTPRLARRHMGDPE